MATVFKLSVTHINDKRVLGPSGQGFQTFFLPATSVQFVSGLEYSVRQKGLLAGGTYATLTQSSEEDVVVYNTASDIVALDVVQVDNLVIPESTYSLNIGKILFIRENKDGTIEIVTSVNTTANVYKTTKSVSWISDVFDADDVVIPDVDTTFLGQETAVNTEAGFYTVTSKNKITSLVNCGIEVDTESDFPFSKGDKFVLYAGAGSGCYFQAHFNGILEDIYMRTGEFVLLTVVEHNGNIYIEPVVPIIEDSEDNVFKTLARYEYDGLYKRERIEFACSDEVTPIEVAADLIRKEAGVNIAVLEIRAFLSTPQATGSAFSFDILKNGTTILEAPMSFTNTEDQVQGYPTAEITPGMTFAVSDVISVDCTQVGDGTACGLKINIIGRPN